MRPSLATLFKYRFAKKSGIMDNPIHLYRHLLRQAGVIYDDIVRGYIPGHIRRRFEANRNATDHRLTEQLREARAGHSLLERANNGYPRALMKVMEMGYGRRGYRRHELMKVSFPVCFCFATSSDRYFSLCLPIASNPILP
jgi:hypothetical protein